MTWTCLYIQIIRNGKPQIVYVDDTRVDSKDGGEPQEMSRQQKKVWSFGDSQGRIQDFWEGGGSILGLQAKKGGGAGGVQFWAQC